MKVNFRGKTVYLSSTPKQHYSAEKIAKIQETFAKGRRNVDNESLINLYNYVFNKNEDASKKKGCSACARGRYLTALEQYLDFGVAILSKEKEDGKDTD